MNCQHGLQPAICARCVPILEAKRKAAGRPLTDDEIRSGAGVPADKKDVP